VNVRAFSLALIAILAFTVPSFADGPVRIQDPEKFVVGIFGSPPRVVSVEAAKTIAVTVGKPSVTDALQGPLKIFDGKKIESLKKVIDNDFGGALRQIIYYAYVEDIGFVYFRFNFKMTGTGWVLANFNFKSETEELFPKDFVAK
jgi:hypothetical protein